MTALRNPAPIGAPAMAVVSSTEGASAPSSLTGFVMREAECSECGGSGGFTESLRVAGEAIDADLCDVDCEECDGTGIAQAGCAHCERVEPLDGEGFCRDCAYVPDFVDATVQDLGNGRAQVQL